MNPLQQYGLAVHVAMAGWYPLCFTLFLVLRPARAVAVGLVAGFLLLPNVVYVLPGIPNYDKSLAIVLGVGLSAVLVDSRRLLAFRLRWVDLPVVILCTVPLVSSLANADGAYLGLSNSFDFGVRWALPWFLGRVYFSDLESQRFLALAIVVGALLYVPCALWEVKMSPQLHRQVYGVMLRSFKHARRAHGLWRPNVFVVHGLAYGLFNALAALLAFWLWFTRSARSLLGFPMGLVVAVLFGMSIAAQSSNAILLLFLGLAGLLAAARFRRALPVLALLLLPPAYVTARQGLRWDGAELVAVAGSLFGPGRASSLETRLSSEALLRDRILERPWFGFNDFREFTGNEPRSEERSPVLVDSSWLPFLGLYGVFALLGLWGMQCLAPFLLWKRLPPPYWGHPALAAAVALGVASLLVALDGLLNAFEIQAFTAGAAGVAHLFGTREGRRLWQA